MVQLALDFGYPASSGLLLIYKDTVPPCFLQSSLGLLRIKLVKYALFALHDCLLALQIELAELVVDLLLESANSLRRDEANCTGVVAVDTYKINCLFLTVYFDNPDPLVHVLLCCTVTRLTLKLILLLLFQTGHLTPPALTHKFLGQTAQQSYVCR